MSIAPAGRPRAAATAAELAGISSSGVVVHRMSRSTSAPLIPARSSASLPAAAASVPVVPSPFSGGSAGGCGSTIGPVAALLDADPASFDYPLVGRVEQRAQVGVGHDPLGQSRAPSGDGGTGHDACNQTIGWPT